MPSVRQASQDFGVSRNTVLQAYMMLEQRGRIAPRPQSGYYVRSAGFDALPRPRMPPPPAGSTQVDISSIIFEIWGADTRRATVRMGSLFPAPDLLPLRQLNRLFARYVRDVDPFIAAEVVPPGSPELRRQIAKRYLARGYPVLPEEITITDGGLDAMNLCLSAVAKAGDTVAVSQPCFPTQLLALERYGLKVVEVPVDAEYGMDLQKLADAIARHKIKAVLSMTTFQNPMGCTMPDERKRELVDLLAKHEIPLIEDDVNAELAFDGVHRKPAKAYDKQGLVLHFSSFSTWLALGHRVGWVAAGRFTPRVLALQHISALSPSAYSQLAVYEYLVHGPVERNLNTLRETLRSNLHKLVDGINDHFPEHTSVTQPEGGYLLWVRLQEKIDSMALYREALAKGISIAPGPMFCPRNGLRNYMRLNFGVLWNERADAAVRQLGTLAKKQFQR